MTNEQKLKKRFAFVITDLAFDAEKYEEYGGYDDLVNTLRNARELLCDLYEDWAKRRDPVLALTPAIKARWLRELANQIEEEDNDEE
ncbi:MAG: hypothetical protein IKP64_11425 [Selenomonadaceae bacterium]|nr:hypothetical protein [Selenomonadaceae bacterium]MBR4384154.1 hypothetical protein [Selenomonadaceae bacterium]